jgi:hypothetical protein
MFTITATYSIPSTSVPFHEEADPAGHEAFRAYIAAQPGYVSHSDYTQLDPLTRQRTLVFETKQGYDNYLVSAYSADAVKGFINYLIENDMTLDIDTEETP